MNKTTWRGFDQFMSDQVSDPTSLWWVDKLMSWQVQELIRYIGDDISIKSANVKLNINDVCNLISVSSERFN
jgi:hypothetical protein